MRKKQKGKNVRHELENNTDYSNLSDEKNVNIDGEMISEKEYMRRFNNEWYYGSRNGEYKVINSVEGRREAERNNNRNKRDVMSLAERTGTLSELTDDESQFMNEASNEWEWQNVYKTAGPKEATLVIYEQAKRDILDKIIELDVILSRFVIKMMKLKTLNERKRKRGKKHEK